MDPFEPIRVDPEQPANDLFTEAKKSSTEDDESRAAARLDPADAALAAAHNLYFLGALENRNDAALAGAAEVTGAAAEPVILAPVDPFNDGEYDAPPANDSEPGAGCGIGALALLVSLTLAASTAFAVIR